MQDVQEELLVDERRFDLLLHRRTTRDTRPANSLHPLQPRRKDSLSFLQIPLRIDNERRLPRVNEYLSFRSSSFVGGRIESGEVDSIAKESDGGNSGDRLLLQGGNGFPGEGLNSLVEDEEDVFGRGGRRRKRFVEGV